MGNPVYINDRYDYVGNPVYIDSRYDYEGTIVAVKRTVIASAPQYKVGIARLTTVPLKL